MSVNLLELNYLCGGMNQSTLIKSLIANACKTYQKKNVPVTNSSAASYDKCSFSAHKKKGYISDDTLDAINNNISSLRGYDDIYVCNGVSFAADQIPAINGSSLKEVKADKNVINFGKERYFKYVSDDGKEHLLYTDDYGVGGICSEYLRGAPYDDETEQYSEFWNFMTSRDPLVASVYFSDEQTKNYLGEAGIQPGFFTVKMGNREATQFYSDSKICCGVYSKERYDVQYKCFTSDSLFLKDYEPGSIFKVSGKEYVLSKSHTLDIPYGEDVYDVEYPENYCCGIKMY